jgi:NAD(P)-dependent dehydrogenase (short-subunit alcohol dehydrogenase family)
MSKTFLFAGASSAIAKQAALQLKERGDRVIGISTKTLDGIYDESHQVTNYDFSSFPAIEGPLDGLVYFPGTINLKPFARLSAAEFMNDFQINTLGAAAFAQSYLNNLKKSPSASIVFLSSVAATTGLPFHTSIAMAKGGIEGFTKALAAELAPQIRVNAVAPSLVNTPLGDKFVNTPEKLEQMQKRNPLRHVGNASDVANAIVFLLSDTSAWVSGQVFAIDGGMGTLKI